MPSDVSSRVGAFDRFAGHSANIASRAPFFAACVALIVIWAPTIFLLNFDTSQLLINTATTIVTFLLVALLQNSQTRNDQATQHKLNAIADGLADLMEHVGGDDREFRTCIHELRLAVGLEAHEGTTHAQGEQGEQSVQDEQRDHDERDEGNEEGGLVSSGGLPTGRCVRP
jgi:low affinity Fe/Cu permease